jgi:hypothetical protein
MRAFRNELALALALIVFPAAAQQSPPVRLAPPQRLAPPPAAAPSEPVPAPVPGEAGRAPAAPAAPAEAAPSGIQVAPLPPVDPEWTGTLGEDRGGFPPTLWQGTRRRVVLALVPALPVTTSPVLQTLERRLLLANALPPAGREESAGFLALRAEKLIAMGLVEDAAALLQAAPGESEALERARIELKLLAGDRDGACQAVGEAIRRRQGLWWDRALVACNALAGKHEEAALGLGLLREQKAPKDAAFDALVERLGGRETRLPPMPQPTPLHLALLRAAKLPYPGDLAGVSAPAALRMIALTEGTPAQQRLAAAQRAAAFGALTPDELRRVYDAVEFTAEERANALSRAKEEKGARGRALLWTAAKAQSLPGPRAELLQALLAEAEDDYVVAARTVEPLLAEIPPSPELAWFGADAARAFYAAGRPADARAWGAVAGPEAAKTLGPLARLAEGAALPLPDLPQERAAQAALFLGLVEALGDALPADAWAPYLEPGAATPAPLPPAALLLAQGSAIEGRRLGEALLLILPTLAEGERLTGEPLLLVRAVAGLRALGLEETARALAIEAALAAGF